ncbi:MAG: DUF1738 domain-containing protein [Prevotella sp.]|nr:DUF1738 domain-containing protein [Prevotella sp.]
MYRKKSSEAAANGEYKSKGQKAVDKFTEMMISRMESMKAGDWRKGWIDGSAAYGMPQNISGRNYSGSNSFFLQMDSAMHGYKTPVYLTFLQIQKENARIRKGAESMPVIYWDFSIQDKDGKRIDRNEYRRLSEEERTKYTVIPFLKAYNVFNVDQTDLEEVNKEKYNKLLDRFKAPEIKDAEGMYVNAAMDRLFEKQEWVCPIQVDQISEDAYYSPSRDKIVVPKKEQFNIGDTPEEVYKDGMEYYSSALHEMAHSTGTEGRLNRIKGDRFGDPKYAKEELVAELTAANVGYAMGFDKRILDNNAAYLDGWIAVLKENPKFIVSVMADVNKASMMVLEAVDKQKMALGEEPILDRNKVAKEPNAVIVDFEDAAIIKKKNGEYAVRASYQGMELGMKEIDRETGMRYMLMPEGKEKTQLLAETLSTKFSQDIIGMEHSVNRNYKIG